MTGLFRRVSEFALGIGLAVGLALPALAAPERIATAEAFAKIVGKPLTPEKGAPIVLQPGGGFAGKVGGEDLKGKWWFEGGYFCRTLATKARDFGTDCQLVMLDGKTVTFTGERGKGARKTVYTLK